MTDYTHWHVGMKVVCVRDGCERPQSDGITWADWPSCVAHGEVFTVREIEMKFAGRGVIAIRLAEYSHPIDRRGWEVAFPACYFRPIVSRPTDISIFTAMLDQKHVGAPERVD